MNKIELNGISATLDQLKMNLEKNDYYIRQYDLPQISTPTFNTGFLSGISLSNERVSQLLQYKDDIFSELPIKVFDKTYNAQMSDVMNLFRKEFKKRFAENRSEKIIPKLEYHQDEEAELIRMTSQWNQGNAMLYFSFENNPEESNFGMLWNDNKSQNYHSRSGNLFLSITSDVIHEAIDFIFRVYNI